MAAWMYSPNIIRHKELDEIIAFRFRPSRRHASSRPALSARLSSCHWIAWQPPLGRAVRDCGDVVRAGWLVLQAIVSEG